MYIPYISHILISHFISFVSLYVLRLAGGMTPLLPHCLRLSKSEGNRVKNKKLFWSNIFKFQLR